MVVLVGGLAAGVGTVVHATEPTGWRADPIPMPPRAGDEDAVQPRAAASQGVIFVNFDGAMLAQGNDDAKNNTTFISQLAGPFAAYGEGSKRDAVMQAVRDDWAAYNVVVTDQRPQSGEYTMNMTGPTNPYGGGVLGIAPVDCDDARTHSNITFAFHSASDPHSATVTATTIGQEVAHSYGLEHVQNPADIMHPQNAGGDASFHDSCITLDRSPNCPDQHVVSCGSQTQQNAHQELLTLFGPAVADDTGPTVTITSPADGAQFDQGDDFTVQATVVDEGEVVNAVLWREDAQLGEDAAPPYAWDARNAAVGTYRFRVEAEDAAGNVGASAEITIRVADEAAGGSGAGESGESGSDSGADDEDEQPNSPIDDDAAYPAGFGERRDADSCGCRQPRSPGPSLWLMIACACAAPGRRRRSVRDEQRPR